MFEVVRWVSLSLVWLCIGINAWCIVRNILNLRRWRREQLQRLAQIDKLTEILCSTLTTLDE